MFDSRVSAAVVARLGERRAMAAGALAWACVYAVTPPLFGSGMLAVIATVVATVACVSVSGVALYSWVSRNAGADAQGRAGGALQSASAGYQVGAVDFLTMLNSFTVLNDYQVQNFEQRANLEKAVTGLEDIAGLLPELPPSGDTGGEGGRP